MQITLMHNPGAGSGKPTADELLEAFKKAGYEPKYQSTKEDNFSQALENAGEMVVVAGGDGTIGKVVKKMVGVNVPLTFLPIGTANNIAKTFNLTGSPLDLIRSIPSFKKTKFNVGIVKGPWGEKRFIEAVGFGIFPKMMKEYEKVKNRGLDKEAEVQEALQFLKDVVKDAPAYPCTLVVDGECFKGDFLLVEIMNIKTMGPNLPLAADANPGDNFFEIVMIKAQEREAFEEYLDNFIKGHTPALDLTVRRGSNIQFYWQKFKMHIDDDVWPENNGSWEKDIVSTNPPLIEISMESDKLDLFVPEF